MPYGLDSKSPEFAEFTAPDRDLDERPRTRRRGRQEDEKAAFVQRDAPAQVEPQPGRKKPKSGAYGGFILKNFAFRERSGSTGPTTRKTPLDQDPEAVAVVAGAPNRGGTYTQFAHSVFYEQQVRFAEGPEDGKDRPPRERRLAPPRQRRAEGGSIQSTGQTAERRAGPATASRCDHRQADRRPTRKLGAGARQHRPQRPGRFQVRQRGPGCGHRLWGPPVIPDQFVPYPEEADQAARQTLDIATPPYYDPDSQKLATPGDFENPSIEWTLNPNLPLRLAVEMIEPRAHMHWRVTTLEQFGGDSQGHQHPFRGTQIGCDRVLGRLLAALKGPEREEVGEVRLPAHNQTVLMEMEISTHGGKTYKKYVFPHITSNVVKKVAGTPTQARAATKTPPPRARTTSVTRAAWRGGASPRPSPRCDKRPQTPFQSTISALSWVITPPCEGSPPPSKEI